VKTSISISSFAGVEDFGRLVPPSGTETPKLKRPGRLRPSSLPEERQVDLDPAASDVDRADRVADERHEQILLAFAARDLEHLARRQRQQPADGPDQLPAVANGAALEILGPPLVLAQLATSSPCPDRACAAARSSQPSSRTIGRASVPARRVTARSRPPIMTVAPSSSS